MKVIERRRATILASDRWKCEHCGRLLPRDAFGRSDKLANGRHPWCCDCAGRMTESAESRVAYKAAYQRSYMRRRREDSRSCWLTVAVLEHGVMLARWSALRREVRITGPFALREEALRILTGAFGVGVGDVAESGRGAGRGTRRQKTFSSRAPVGPKAWVRGRDLLVAEGLAKIGKGGVS